MKMKTEQATRIKTFANDIGAKYGLYRPLIEDILYDYVREATPKKLRQFLDESPAVDDYLNRVPFDPSEALSFKKDEYAAMMNVCIALNQLDICIEKAENRLCNNIAKYIKFKNLEVKEENTMNSTVYDALLKNMSPELMANLIKCPPKNYQKTKCRAVSCRECVASFLEQDISDDDVANLIKQVMKNYYYIQI